MNAIILAGGEGTRLKSVTGALPKPMAVLGGKPILAHILALLRRCGVRRACVTLRYRPEVIRDYFGDGRDFGLELSYHVEETPLGTAGAVRACRDFCAGRDVLVISGDCACDADLRPLAEARRRLDAAAVLGLYPQPDPLQYGVVLTDRSRRVVGFVEKPRWGQVVSDLVNTGIYVLSPRALDRIPEGRPFDFAKDLFPLLLAEGERLFGLPLEGYWCDIGTPRSYFQSNLDALDGKLRLEGAEESHPPEPAAAAAAEPEGAVQRALLCRSRARLMRRLSETLMEAGADFSDGITLAGAAGKVHIAPEPDGEAVRVAADSEALCERYARLARELEAQET